MECPARRLLQSNCGQWSTVSTALLQKTWLKNLNFLILTKHATTTPGTNLGLVWHSAAKALVFLPSLITRRTTNWRTSSWPEFGNPSPRCLSRGCLQGEAAVVARSPGQLSQLNEHMGNTRVEYDKWDSHLYDGKSGLKPNATAMSWHAETGQHFKLTGPREACIQIVNTKWALL